MDDTITSSPFLDTKVSTIEDDSLGSKFNILLGLKSGTGNPKVLSLLSSILQKSVESNESWLQTTHTKDIPTIFHGSRAPALTIQQYIDRIFKYSRCSPSCFVVAHIYIDRLIESENIILTSLNVHRLLITSIMLATKFIDEAFFNNAYYARVGGVTTSEMNRLEMKFLFGIDFQLYVNLSTFERYCLELMSETTGEVIQIEGPLHSIHDVRGLKDKWSNNKIDTSYHATIGVHIH
ncbi:cyclin-P3-1-like [Rutidosis leptorrhynchoides]|uniref:cyclin-P3-1-like n=1 Tax=Rutidosis leptorrhynchoides TaxID=125765 RepID=UPI003A9A40C1